MAALESLDLAVAAGDCVVLMGPNGSGKTTAAELICGLQEPSDGCVEINGFSIHNEPDSIAARKYLSYVPDTPYLYHDLTVRDHLRLVAAAHGVADGESGGDLEECIDLLLESLGLEQREDFFPSQLSRGMRQKTAIACAVIRPFLVLVLDEPTIGLDAASVTALRDLLLASKADGKAVLLMTHDEAFAASVATRVLPISEGRVAKVRRAPAKRPAKAPAKTSAGGKAIRPKSRAAREPAGGDGQAQQGATSAAAEDTPADA